MTYAHTLCFYKFQKFNPRPKTKNPISGSGSSDFSELTVTGRPARSTDVHKLCMCISVDRPGRPRHICVHRIFRSTDPVDRRAPTVGFLTVGGRPTRSTDYCQFFWQFQQLFFLANSLLGFDTNDFVRLFLTPINRGSPHIDKTTIAK